jgi:hypothetical protein
VVKFNISFLLSSMVTVLLSSTRVSFPSTVRVLYPESGFLRPSGNLGKGVSCLPVSASEVVGAKRLSLSLFLGHGTAEYVP